MPWIFWKQSDAPQRCSPALRKSKLGVPSSEWSHLRTGISFRMGSGEWERLAEVHTRRGHHQSPKGTTTAKARCVAGSIKDYKHGRGAEGEAVVSPTPPKLFCDLRRGQWRRPPGQQSERQWVYSREWGFWKGILDLELGPYLRRLPGRRRKRKRLGLLRPRFCSPANSHVF